jgi:hypothetical protein
MDSHPTTQDDAIHLKTRLAPRLVPWIVLGLVGVAIPIVHLLVVSWKAFNPLALLAPIAVLLDWMAVLIAFDLKCPSRLSIVSGELLAEWPKEQRSVRAPLAELTLRRAPHSNAHFRVTVLGSSFPISAYLDNIGELVWRIDESGGSVEPQLLDAFLKRGWFREFGPHTDPAKMSPPEIFQSARVFLATALAASAVLAGLFFAELNHLIAVEHPVALTVMGVSVLALLMGVVGGVYLLIRGCNAKRA